MSRSSVKIQTWETGQQIDCNTKSTAKSVKESLTNAEITKDEDTDLDKGAKKIGSQLGLWKMFSQTTFQSLSLYSSF